MFAFMSWMSSLSLARCNLSHFELTQIESHTPEFSNFLFFADQCLSRIEQFLYSWFLTCISYGVIFSKKDCCMHRWSHEYSPNNRMLINSFLHIAWKKIQYNSQPLIHFFFEWDWTGRKNIAFFFRLQATASIPTFSSRYSCEIFSLTRFLCNGRPCCGPRSGLLMPLLRVCGKLDFLVDWDLTQFNAWS